MAQNLGQSTNRLPLLRKRLTISIIESKLICIMYKNSTSLWYEDFPVVCDNRKGQYSYGSPSREGVGSFGLLDFVNNLEFGSQVEEGFTPVDIISSASSLIRFYPVCRLPRWSFFRSEVHIHRTCLKLTAALCTSLSRP